MNIKIFITNCLFLFLAGLAFAQGNKGVTVIASGDQSKMGKTWALIVGISEYKNIQSLRYADKDAQMFYDYLTSYGPRIDTNHVKLLKNENATSGDIYGALEWLRESVEPGDRVIFYFSGHGDVERNTIYQNGFLLAFDSPNAAYMTVGTISTQYLQDYVETYVSANKARDVLVIVDACRSGKLAGGTAGAQLTMRALGTNWNNQIIKILSAQEGELSYEDVKWGGGHGVFSFYLMKGLEGLADRNNDSKITTTELSAYLPFAVSDLTNNTQNPKIEGNPNEVLFDYNPRLLQMAKTQETTNEQSIVSISRGSTAPLSTEIQSEYEKYLAYLKVGRLIWGKNAEDSLNCARHIYVDLINKIGAKTIQSSLKSSFITALQRKTQISLDEYVKEDIDGIDYNESYLELSYLKTLINPTYILYNYVLARTNFIESLYTIDPKKSIELLKNTLKLEEDAPYALNQLGYEYFLLKIPDSTMYYCERAIKAAPQWAYPYSNIGIAYLNKRDFKNALIYLNKSVTLDKLSAIPYINLGIAYQDMNDEKNAILSFKDGLLVAPQSEKLYTKLGFAYVNIGDVPNCINSLLKAFTLSPRSISNNYNLARAYSLNKDITNGLKYLHRALEFGLNNYDYIKNDEMINDLKKQPQFKMLMKKYFPNEMK